MWNEDRYNEDDEEEDWIKAKVKKIRYAKDTNFIDFRKLKEELSKDNIPRLFSPDDKMREFRFK